MYHYHVDFNPVIVLVETDAQCVVTSFSMQIQWSWDTGLHQFIITLNRKVQRQPIQYKCL